ncbi:bifunctional 4-hydroxy-3-methylbut-2-enyl diphosphate reductase/30S ribosomal protein S1 [Paludicola sp. MB14-C6]|uniref:bifunctional 4-hydroxy-3-methylbut-2-enyl diphosphate reductase/30S ribosomal protein S1 n=1 Tax=Paludihabitans sp. MB14-C6 TaxID=3070656 RepID=UPI0027DBB4BD|nr:bifunctional 4-hydroxy-3-methylbut-2-enyl diphosphate reductase/30S ribosomal protein S1 [Paludicola sp. MB14-C6]WMJ23526.1 bifunctional 4-hydroxy-3-methylbut-2-enyl diphosphate reductase/30S ribosomal protein S1 [Paludicola sp. MB14-C6]
MITLAKSAGFCFGVDRAVNLVFDILKKGQKVASLGPIIHNDQLVLKLQNEGARIINTPQEAKKDEIVVIRSHGVPLSIYTEFAKENISFADATCPYVSKIHKIVKEQSINGKTVIIAGDDTHPEVCGIQGHCIGKSYVVANAEELESLYHKLSDEEKNNSILVAQTTFNTIYWNECALIAKKLYTNIKLFDTICSATSIRQSEAASLAAMNDIMFVIGGKHSSNTKKLSQVCSQYCKTVLIETKDELFDIDLFAYDKIGITAGASTPAYIIEEVLKTMSEILRNEENELDFATLLEQSLESEKIYNGKRVKGYVTNVAANEVHVDIGAKQAGIIPADELSDNPTLKVEDIVKKGDELDLVVVKVNDQEGIVTLSKKRCDALAGFENLKKAYEEDAVIDGVITDVVRGGVLVFACNTKLFVPASQASDKRVEDLTTLLKQNVKLKVIEINEKRNRAKGSVRAVLATARKEKQAKFWDEVEVGKTFTGEVKSLTPYGAFVDLGGVDGMIHVTELSWSKIKHPSEVLKEGEVVEVYIKDVDKEKKRISLGYKKSEENPWVIFSSKYNVDDVVDAKVVSFTTYGAFAEIIPGVDGLIHISQIANKRVDKIADVLKVGQDVQAKIIEIDANKKRVSLSMRALLSEEEQKRDRENIDEAVEAGIIEEPTAE